jgi:hypothetical protein
MKTPFDDQYKVAYRMLRASQDALESIEHIIWKHQVRPNRPDYEVHASVSRHCAKLADEVRQENAILTPTPIPDNISPFRTRQENP